MTWNESFRCDICGKLKLESNHWWMVKLANVPYVQDGHHPRQFALVPWNSEESRDAKVHHICGEGCATKALERFMSSGTLAAEMHRVTSQTPSERLERRAQVAIK